MAHELNFAEFSFGTQVRKSPYSDAALRWGAKGFSVYNHMYTPRDYGSSTEDTQMLTGRDLSKCAVGQCKYVILTDQDGGIINDPVLLKLAEDHFWLSIADSDVLLWARGVALNSGMDVEIREPDVSPLQLQGPKSRDVLRAAFGDAPTELKYYWFMEYDWDGVPLIISRTGWSSELGYEIFLRDGSAGDRLWEHIMAVGTPLGLKPGHTSSIRRIEAGMLSYHADMNLANNPYELNMDRLINLDIEMDFIGKAALTRIKEKGVSQQLVGLEIEGVPFVGSNDFFWPVMKDGTKVGTVTSAIYSPRLNKNIALGMLKVEHSDLGTELIVDKLGETRGAIIVPIPFHDPKKSIAVAS